MFEIEITTQFKKDLKRLKKRSKKDYNKLESFLELLVDVGFEGIPKEYKPHSLIGNYKDVYECHIANDLLLLWIEYYSTATTNKYKGVIKLVRTGSHSDLF